MKVKELRANQLYTECKLKGLRFKTTDGLKPLDDIIGQPRALEAIQLGIEIRGEGYNIFASGHPGVGRRTMIRQFLSQRTPDEPAPDDWCYVNNLEANDKPIALRLPAGRAPEFRYDIDQLLEDVQVVLPKAFSSDEYQRRSEELQKTALEVQHERIQEITASAEEKSIDIIWSPTGVAFQPLHDGKPMTPEEIEAFPEAKRKELEETVEVLQKRILEAMKEAPKAFREARHKLEELNKEVARQAFEPLVDELRQKYAEFPGVIAHLDALMKHLMDHALALIQSNQTDGEMGDGDDANLFGAKQTLLFEAYRVNELVTRDPKEGAPVVYEDNPTFENLLGRIEYVSQMGTLLTDFSLIKPGSLHKANGGYLILHAHRLFSTPFAWEALKLALRAKEIRIDSAHSFIGMVSTVSLEPEPIPLDVKVILIGSSYLYHLLQAYDPDFPDLFKVAADFSDDMNRSEEEENVYARLVATLIKRHKLPAFDRPAVQRIIEHSSRMAGDTQKLTVRVRAIGGLLQEAVYWAGRDGRDTVGANDVQRAVDGQVFRLDRVKERLHENIARGTLLIDTSGSTIGQVNGLSVFGLGDHYFGQPSRITAQTRLGDGNVVDIEREIKMGGPSHSKGVLILQGLLMGRYARHQPFALSASIVFEQSYGGVDGDSATCAEFIALLSSISGVPLKQNIAITGSMNQHGEAQAIGGVNEKIEGFFDVCSTRGLDGSHGVLIPQANVKHLMLRADVVEAVKQKQFHVYTMNTVDDGLEVLTGMTAGTPNAKGGYPKGSVNAAVAKAVAESAAIRKRFHSDKGDDETSDSS